VHTPLEKIMNRKQQLALGAVAAFGLVAISGCSPSEEESISIVGSSTVYPFSIVASELFARESDYGAPKVESTGSGGGMKLFCADRDLSSPSITNASRRMKKSEQDKCNDNGIDRVIEVKIGYDGIVIAHTRGANSINLSQRQIFLALAREIPDGSNWIANPHQTWSDVNSRLPDSKISVYGPPPTSGTRDAFVELVMEKGCATFPEAKALKKSDKSRFKALCHAMREDGAFIEAGENDNLIIQKIVSNPDSFGIFGYSFLEENRDKVQAVYVDDVLPEFENIVDGSYPVSRPLYFYVKAAHYGRVDGLREFVEFFVSEDIMGNGGALSERGLVPLSEGEYSATVKAVENTTPMPTL